MIELYIVLVLAKVIKTILYYPYLFFSCPNNFSFFFLDVKTKDYLLVTQYADGGDLRSYLKKNSKKLAWYDKKKLAYQIADGLNYLHSENVLHRDLVSIFI
jgi:serine/threonine protein kinase